MSIAWLILILFILDYLFLKSAIKSKSASKKDVILVLILFILLMISPILSIIIKPIYGLTSGGNYFLVFGFITLFMTLNDKKTIRNTLITDKIKSVIMPTLLLVVGFMLILVSILLNFNIMKVDILCILGFLLLIFVLGIILVTFGIFDLKVPKECNTLIRAKCVGYEKERKNHHGIIHYYYCPIYEYTFLNKTYKKCDNLFLGGKWPQINDYNNIFINPDNPNHFFDKTRRKIYSKSNLSLGIIFILSSFGLLLLFILYYLPRI